MITPRSAFVTDVAGYGYDRTIEHDSITSDVQAERRAPTTLSWSALIALAVLVGVAAITGSVVGGSNTVSVLILTVITQFIGSFIGWSIVVAVVLGIVSRVRSAPFPGIPVKTIMWISVVVASLGLVREVQTWEPTRGIPELTQPQEDQLRGYVRAALESDERPSLADRERVSQLLDEVGPLTEDELAAIREEFAAALQFTVTYYEDVLRSYRAGRLLWGAQEQDTMERYNVSAEQLAEYREFAERVVAGEPVEIGGQEAVLTEQDLEGLVSWAQARRERVRILFTPPGEVGETGSG